MTMAAPTSIMSVHPHARIEHAIDQIGEQVDDDVAKRDGQHATLNGG